MMSDGGAMGGAACWLPQEFRVAVVTGRTGAGGVASEQDLMAGTAAPVWIDSFGMSLQPFASAGRVAGLLMWDRWGRLAETDGPDLASPLNPRWLFFGYVCSRCGECFLVPEWVEGRDDLPGATLHGCGTGAGAEAGVDSREEWLRGQWEQTAEVIAVRTVDWMICGGAPERLEHEHAQRITAKIAAVAREEIARTRRDLARTAGVAARWDQRAGRGRE
jgi:hypothetical protein